MMAADFHSHILPCVDDGSRSVSESLEMLRCCAGMGIENVVLTPHFYPHRDRPDRFLARRKAAFENLQEAAREEDLPRLFLGAELHYFPNMSSSDILPQFVIGGGRYLLVEMPMCRWTDRMYRELELIWENQGLIPIIAHLDRYLTPFTRRKMLRRLSEMRVLIQANGSFFLNRSTARLALRMLAKDQIDLLGSDCHNLSSRKPDLGPVRERIRARLGEEALERIARNEAQVLGTERGPL